MVYPTFYFASSVLVNCLTKVVNLSFACIVDNFLWKHNCSLNFPFKWHVLVFVITKIDLHKDSNVQRQLVLIGNVVSGRLKHFYGYNTLLLSVRSVAAPAKVIAGFDDLCKAPHSCIFHWVIDSLARVNYMSSSSMMLSSKLLSNQAKCVPCVTLFVIYFTYMMDILSEKSRNFSSHSIYSGLIRGFKIQISYIL